MRLLLIRHGRSAHVHSGEWLDRGALERWRDAYDRAGIADDDRPPAAVVDEVGRADMLVASDQARAIASAAHLAFGKEVTISRLFREERLPIPRGIPFSLPLSAWETLVHLRWFIDRALRRDAGPEALERATQAARWCHDGCRAPDGGERTIAIVTHGVFRRLLATRLIAEGWRLESGRLSYENWSVWRFSRHDTPSNGDASPMSATR